MPRNVNGTYSLPLPPVVPNTTIEADWANTTDDDIAQALTDSLDRNGRGGMAGPFRLVDGTVGAPGLAFTAETGTGLSRESSGVLGVSVQGVKRGQWTAAGLSVVGALSAASGTFTGTIATQADADGVLEWRSASAAVRGSIKNVFINSVTQVNGVGGIEMTNNIVQTAAQPLYTFKPGTDDAYPGLVWADAAGAAWGEIRGSKNPGPGGSEFSIASGKVGDPGFITFLSSGVTRFEVKADGRVFYTAPVGPSDEVGFRDTPRQDITNGWVITPTERGRVLGQTDGGSAVIVDGSVGMSSGDTVTIINFTATTVFISTNNGALLRLAGTTSTGQRTLAPFGVATLWWSNSSECFCSGNVA